MVLTDKTIEALKKRYVSVPPLIFQRSIDRARNDTELFDILEGVPLNYPLVWCDEDRAWVKARDLKATWSFNFERIK